MEDLIDFDSELADLDTAMNIVITPRRSGGYVVTGNDGSWPAGMRLTLGEVVNRIVAKSPRAT